MATPPCWTKTTFLSWFEQQRPKLIDLTARLFGAALKTCGLSEEDAVHEALVRFLRKRRYQRCGVAMERWFLQDVKWTILDARKKAKRMVSLDADPESASTSGDDVGQAEHAVASDDVATGPSWMYVYCHELPPFIKSCTHRLEEEIPGICAACGVYQCPAYEWASYQLELRNRAARRRAIHRPGSDKFWPTYRAAGDRVPVKDRDGNLQQRDQRRWKQALRTELWNYRNRLETPQVEAADSGNTIYQGLVRCTGRGSRNGHQPEPPEPWSCPLLQRSCTAKPSCQHRDEAAHRPPVPSLLFIH